MKRAVTISVNGVSHTTGVEPRTLLVHFLRRSSSLSLLPLWLLSHLRLRRNHPRLGRSLILRRRFGLATLLRRLRSQLLLLLRVANATFLRALHLRLAALIALHLYLLLRCRVTLLL